MRMYGVLLPISKFCATTSLTVLMLCTDLDFDYLEFQISNSFINHFFWSQWGLQHLYLSLSLPLHLLWDSPWRCSGLMWYENSPLTRSSCRLLTSSYASIVDVRWPMGRRRNRKREHCAKRSKTRKYLFDTDWRPIVFWQQLIDLQKAAMKEIRKGLSKALVHHVKRATHDRGQRRAHSGSAPAGRLPHAHGHISREFLRKCFESRPVEPQVLHCMRRSHALHCQSRLILMIRTANGRHLQRTSSHLSCSHHLPFDKTVWIEEHINMECCVHMRCCLVSWMLYAVGAGSFTAADGLPRTACSAAKHEYDSQCCHWIALHMHALKLSSPSPTDGQGRNISGDVGTLVRRSTRAQPAARPEAGVSSALVRSRFLEFR